MLSRRPRLRLRSRFMEIGRSSLELPPPSPRSPLNEKERDPLMILLFSLVRRVNRLVNTRSRRKNCTPRRRRESLFSRSLIEPLSPCFFFGGEGCWPTPKNLETIVPKEGEEGTKVSFPVLKLYKDGPGVESRVVWEQVGLKLIPARSAGLNRS